MEKKDENNTSIIRIGSNALVRAGNSIEITQKLQLSTTIKKTALAQPKGQLKWKFKTEFNVISSPAIMDGVVCFGSNDGYLYAVE